MNPRLHLLIIILCFLLIGGGVTAIIYHEFYLLEYHEVDIDFKVRAGEAGLNIDTDALHFGHIPPGGSSSRRMIITPVHDARLVIRFSGEAAPMISMEQSVFDAKKDVPINISFHSNVPKDTPNSEFNGTAHFYFYRW